MIYIFTIFFSSLSHFNEWHIKWHFLRFFTHPYSTQHQFIWSRHHQVKCRYSYWLQSFLLIALHRATINQCFIRLFFSFAATIHSHIYLSREHGQTKEKSWCCMHALSQPVDYYFREASEMMIIVVRFFVRLYSSLVYPIYFSVRPYYAMNGQTNALAFNVCMCVRVCAYSLTSKRTCSLPRRVP
jgi:hypothetical protein